MDKFYKRKGDDASATIECSSAPESERQPLALVVVEQLRQNEEHNKANRSNFKACLQESNCTTKP
jgi:hypothetical protein